MAGNPHAMAELRALLSSREPLYARADLTVDASTLSVEEAAETIVSASPARRNS